MENGVIFLQKQRQQHGLGLYRGQAHRSSGCWRWLVHFSLQQVKLSSQNYSFSSNNYNFIHDRLKFFFFPLHPQSIIIINPSMLKKYKVKEWIKAMIPQKYKQEEIQQVFEVQKFEQYNYEEEEWTEAQAEIINQIINMYNLMKITKQLDLQEYLTLKEINQILCQEKIQKSQVRKCLLGGLSIYNQQTDKKSLTKHLPYQYYSVRALLWEISLGYLPDKNKSKWVSMMEANLQRYKSFVKEYIIQAIEKKVGVSMEKKESLEDKDVEKLQEKQEKQEKKKDHPLNFSKQSKWKNYFNDVELWKVIEKDTTRTRRSCKFFSQYFQYDLQGEETFLTPGQLTFTQSTQTYTDVLTRLLFIYLKNHPEESYCQGMNEFIALFYYCLTNKNSEYFRRVSESNAYFLFEILMKKLPKKHFQRGPQYVTRFMEMLKKLDLRLYEEIQKQNGLHSMKVIIMKWFLTGFLTQFTIDDCLQLWDGIISFPSQVYLIDYFYYIGLGIVHLNRQRIIDEENVLIIFSSLKNFGIDEVVDKSNSLFKLFPKLWEEIL